MRRHWSTAAVLTIGVSVFVGCSQSSPPPVAQKSTGTSPAANATSLTTSSNGPKVTFWEDYPDVPKFEIMTEVDGIKIPRQAVSKQSGESTDPIPVDVGNEHAAKKPSTPVTGDTLTIRLNAEPKVLNTVTENSAVLHYIMANVVQDNLYRQNMENFSWTPKIAKKMVFEDAVKLAADYPGRVRRMIVDGGTATASFEIDYVVPPAEGDKPAKGPQISILTTDQEGKPAGRTWVGIFPVGEIVGAAKTGYHQWSDAEGKLAIGGFPAGKYTLKTGDEVFGTAERQDDGSLTVTPATAENPLREKLVLKREEWQDLQEKTYGTFYLREEAKWSDGAPFTSKDMEFAQALMQNDDVDGDSARIYYADLVECQGLGPYVVRMKYRQQYFLEPDYLYQLPYYTPPFHFFEEIFKAQGRELTLKRLTPEEEAKNKQISALGQEFGKFFNTDERYNSKPLGTGPYIVDKWERKDRVELVRNPHYWDQQNAGYVDRIIYKFIPDQTTAFTAMKAGEIDFLYDMTAEQYFDAWATLDPEIQRDWVRSTWVIPMYQWIGWNQLASPLKDRRVRLALSLLFDRQDFIEKKLHGQAVPISGTSYVFGPGYDHDVAPIGYSPETARDLLTDAGWVDTDGDGILDRNGEKFQIELRMGKGKAINEQLCEILQRNLKSVGIDFKFQTMEWASFVEKFRSKECDAVMLRWVMEPENDPFQLWHSSEAAREKRGSNVISFRNQQADALIEQLRVTLDPKKRQRINQSFHRLLDYEQPYVFLWTPKDFGAYHKRFRNVKWYRLRPGFDLTEWYVPKDEQLHK